MILSDTRVLKIRAHLGLMVVRKDTLLVERKDSWNIKFSVGDSISEYFFHHLFFRRCAICSSDEIALLYFSLRLALFVLSTGVSFGFCLVRCTLLANKISILSKVSMEERPSSITTFIHVIALHEVLRRKYWNFLTVLKLESRLNHLSERDCIARATSTLISQWVGEVEAIDISEVISIRNKLIWDLVRATISLSPMLGLC